jgi:hypothetical protein
MQNPSAVMVRPYNYLYRDTLGGKIYAMKGQDGSIIDSGNISLNQDDKVIQAAMNVTSAGSTLVFLPGTYNIYNEISPTGDINIFGYGATLLASRLLPGGNIFNLTKTVDNVSVLFYGLTFDCANLVGTSIGGGINNDNLVTQPHGKTLKLCQVADCTFLNPRQFSIYCAGAGGMRGQADSTVLIDNCFFDAGTYGNGTDMQNEHITCNGCHTVSITNCRFLGNKSMFLSAKNINLTDIYADFNGQPGGSIGYWGFALFGEFIVVRAVRAVGLGLYLIGPYVSIEAQFPYASLQQLIIDNVFVDVLGHQEPFRIMSYDTNTIVQNVVIRNCHIVQGSVQVYNSSIINKHGVITNLVLENIFLDIFDGNQCILMISDTSINNLILHNCYTPEYTANGSPLRILANRSNVEIKYCDITNINPLPPTYILQLYHTTGSFSAAAVFRKPLDTGITAVRDFNSTGFNVTFWENNGIQTASGNDFTTTFSWDHNLRGVPHIVTVNPLSIAAAESFYLTADSRQIRVIYTTPRPIGFNNLSWQWTAQV